MLVGLRFDLDRHIGVDRLMGYGVKYPTRFYDTIFNASDWARRSVSRATHYVTKIRESPHPDVNTDLRQSRWR